MWYRVFSSKDSPVEPAALLEHLHGQGLAVRASFRADNQGWFQVELLLPGEDEPIKLERYLSGEDGIRAELNTWAAWLESVPDNPQHARLMQQVVSSRQVFTLFRPPLDGGESPVQELCLALCRFLANQTDGVYQEDGRGFFDANGVLLVMET